MDASALDYASKANWCCSYKDKHHLPAWAHPSLHRCPLEPRASADRKGVGTGAARLRSFSRPQRALLRRVLLLYELAARAFHHRPGPALFGAAEQHALFEDRLAPAESAGLNAVYDYLSHVHGLLLRRPAAEWERQLARALPPGALERRPAGSSADAAADALLGCRRAEHAVYCTAPHLEPDCQALYVNVFSSFGLAFAAAVLALDRRAFAGLVRSNVWALEDAYPDGTFLGHDTYEAPDVYEPFDFWRNQGLLSLSSSFCAYHMDVHRGGCVCERHGGLSLSFAPGQDTDENIAVVKPACEDFAARPLSESHRALPAGFSWTRRKEELLPYFPNLTERQLSLLDV